MKKILIIMIPFICSYAYLSAHNMVSVKIKNSTGQTISIPTHQGNITIPASSYAPKNIEVQRGQSYDITIYDENGGVIASKSAKFTPGTYEVLAEQNPTLNNPNARTISVIKSRAK